MKIFNRNLSSKSAVGILAALTLMAQGAIPALLPAASAGSLSKTFVRINRMSASTTTGGTVCATPLTASTEAHVQVAFPGNRTQGAASFGVNSTAGNWTVTTTNTDWPATATAWLGINTATAVSTNTVTFPSTDLVVGTLYCFNFAAASTLSTPSSAGSDLAGTVTTQDSGPATIDSGNYATAVVTSGDQIAVTASVSSTFSLSLSSHSASLGALSTSTPVSATAINATVSTNAQGGYQMWAEDLSASVGLHSTTASKTISYSPAAGSTAAALSNGVEGYNIGAGAHTGTCNGSQTFDANFDNSGGTSFKGGGLDNTLRTVVTGAGTAASCATPLTISASISGTTPAASDYADTITVIAAGVF